MEHARITRSRRGRRLAAAGASGLVAASLGAGLYALPNAGATTKHTQTAHVVKAHSQPTAPPAGPGGGGPQFTVTSMTSTSLVVTDPSGNTQTFLLTASTTFEKDGASASAGDVVEGDHVIVTPTATSGSGSSSSSLTASTVDVVSPSLAGTVVSVSGSGSSLVIVVSDESGFYRTIDTSASTTFDKDGTAVAASTITTGTFLSALGAIATDHTTLDATAVTIGVPAPPSGAPSGGPGRSGSPGLHAGPPPGVPAGAPGGSNSAA